ncbi:hypothetical protein ACFO3D_15105 [Virgibacillus kekensis]|uniref:Uncharacterized protein n=1 Tax=Virgibacillus kekensis TaxID=202261 RepID=A0ABV9DLB1_9BACI
MFVLMREINGTTETLKKSNGHFNKTFCDFNSATLLAKKLNLYTRSNRQWQVNRK